MENFIHPPPNLNDSTEGPVAADYNTNDSDKAGVVTTACATSITVTKRQQKPIYYIFTYILYKYTLESI